MRQKYFPTFGVMVNLRIQFECGKVRNRKTPNALRIHFLGDIWFEQLSKNVHWESFTGTYNAFSVKSHYKLYLNHI